MISFDWRRFYDVGFCMKNISKKEEFQRSAVGRYYYAAFGTVKNYYEKNYEKSGFNYSGRLGQCQTRPAQRSYQC